MDSEYIKESNAIEGIRSLEALNASLSAWEWLTKQPDKLKLEHVLELHRQIMAPFKLDFIPGQLRRCNVRVGFSQKLEFKKVKQALETLLLHSPRSGIGALDWHIEFEDIHPFEDGNGRTGRMIYWHHCVNLFVQPIFFKKASVLEYYGLFKKEPS